MELAMMAAAERHSEFIADLTAKRRRLRESEMVGICWASATNEASPFGDELDMLAVANATRPRQNQHAFVDSSGSSSLASFCRTVFGFMRSLQFVCLVWGKSRNLQLECPLNVLGVGLRQRVFDAHDPVSPTCGLIDRVEVIQFDGKLVS
jgi:hypothetical protein